MYGMLDSIESSAQMSTGLLNGEIYRRGRYLYNQINVTCYNTRNVLRYLAIPTD